jgi:hypothetical protein
VVLVLILILAEEGARPLNVDTPAHTVIWMPIKIIGVLLVLMVVMRRVALII